MGIPLIIFNRWKYKGESGSPTPPIEELDYTDVRAHYAADSISSVGQFDQVDTWLDLTGNGHHLTTITGTQPLFWTGAINDLPAIGFNNGYYSTRYFTFPTGTFADLTSVSIMLVVRGHDDPTFLVNDTGLWNVQSAGDSSHFPYTDGSIYDAFGVTARRTVGNPATPLNQWNVYTVMVGNGTGSSYLNNSLLQEQGSTFGITIPYLLGRNSASQYYGGYIAEVVVFDKNISPTRRNYWETHFQEKYNYTSEPTFPENTIHISSATQITPFRNYLLDRLFSGTGLPTGTFTTQGLSGNALGNTSTNLDHTDDITIDMSYGGVSKSTSGKIWFPLATGSNSKLAIFHHGHAGTLSDDNGAALYTQLTDAGYTVVGLLMVEPTTAQHDSYSNPTASLDYSRFLIEPTIRTINAMNPSSEYDAVYMVGFSGGGWTVDIAGAIDTRISKSIDMQGSFPLYIPVAARDKEQKLFGISPEISFLDLYILCSVETGRKMVKILATNDAFFGEALYNSYWAYHTEIATRATGLGGSFSQQWYVGSHSINQGAIDITLAEFAS